MPDPLSQLSSALQGRKVNEPERIRDRTKDRAGNALSALVDALFGDVPDNLGNAADAVGGGLGAVGGAARAGFNAIPLVPNIGGGAPAAGPPGPGGGAAAHRLALAPLELAAALREFALSRGRANQSDPARR